MEKEIISSVSDEQGYWEVPENIDTTHFDFTWRPGRDRPYIHQFGTQWQKTGGPRYVVHGAEGVKYRTEQHAISLPRPQNFKILVDCAVEFDWSWHPCETEPEFIWTFGNQYLDGREMPTVQYAVGAATDKKFVDDVKAKLVSNRSDWVVHREIDESKWDFSWYPHPYEPKFIYVWGNQYLSPEEMPTVEYRMPGATQYKYMHDQAAKLISKSYNWVVHDQNILTIGFEPDWTPHPYEPPWIYVWGNKWVDGQVKPTLEYRTPGATQVKYMGNDVDLLPSDHYRVLQSIDMDSFDFTWRPDPSEPPWIYVWGNQWLSAQDMPTVEYHAPGATTRKFMDDRFARLANNPEYWAKLHSINESTFDWKWAPHPWDPPFIYVWGNEWFKPEEMHTVEYRVPGATNYKYMHGKQPRMANNPNWWKIHQSINKETFDWTFVPHPYEPPFIYCWGNKWIPAEVSPTVEYVVPGATERKFMPDIVELAPVDPLNHPNWQVPNKDDLQNFDFTWIPNPKSAPYIYQWEGGGPIYTVPGATEVVMVRRTGANRKTSIPRYSIETNLEDLANAHPDEIFWAINPDLDYTGFDFDWEPLPENFHHVNAFGSEGNKDTMTYYVNGPMWTKGYREINYIDGVKIQVVSKLAMFYVDVGVDDRGQFDKLKELYPHIQKTRYFNGWIETVQRCLNKADTKFAWIFSNQYDYIESNFNFKFYPDIGQRDMIHVFGTQWNKWANIYLVNKETFAESTKYIQQIEHAKNINHPNTSTAITVHSVYDILYIDFGNNVELNLPQTCSGVQVYSTGYTGSYLHTIGAWLKDNLAKIGNKKTHLWVLSSLCDYNNFDFTWYVDPFQDEQLHVFGSAAGKAVQKFGDTFVVNTKVFLNELDSLIALEDYSKRVNYIDYMTATRSSHPVHKHQCDSQVDALDQVTNINYPYFELIDAQNSTSGDPIIPLNVWDTSKAPVVIASRGASRILVPTVALSSINTEIYDYEYILEQETVTGSKPLDVIFLSNGEPIAEENWARLQEVVRGHGAGNRVLHIKDVSGRVASQHAAANASSTNWYFLVNGKLKVSDDFDWAWQPDRLQKPKHYIFNAHNPVNGLFYGHQAIVANNKALTLATNIKGLDFTLDSLHDVVDIDCGVAIYNTDPWTAWRTAFREAIKLRSNSDEESVNRLNAWLSPGVGQHAEWSQRGAQDGVEYWESVEGDLQKLFNSYDWTWIQQYYYNKYND